MMKKKRSDCGGFTLVEVIVVLVILTIAAAITVPSFRGYIAREQEKECRINRKAYLGYLNSMRALDPDADMNAVLAKYGAELSCPGGGSYSAPNADTIACSRHGSDSAQAGGGTQVSVEIVG